MPYVSSCISPVISTSRCTPYRDADLGGNCEQLDPPIGDAKNIHSLWDGEMVRALNGSAVSLAANIETYLKALGPEKQAE